MCIKHFHVFGNPIQKKQTFRVQNSECFAQAAPRLLFTRRRIAAAARRLNKKPPPRMLHAETALYQ
jgi:hypothetical protein